MTHYYLKLVSIGKAIHSEQNLCSSKPAERESSLFYDYSFIKVIGCMGFLRTIY